MKNALFCLLCLIVISCSDDSSTEPEPLRVIKSTYLHAYDYAPNFFFLDTVYKLIYEEYFIDYPDVPASNAAKFNRIKSIEVWESTNDIILGEVSAFGVAFADLQSILIMQGEIYPKSMKDLNIVEGKIEKSAWLKLDTNDYTIDRYIGTIRFNSFRPDKYYAVSYTIEGEANTSQDDKNFGVFSAQIGEKDTLILKLICRPNLQPGFKTLWQRQLKNQYYIGEKNINVLKADVKIYWVNENNDTLEYTEEKQISFLLMLGVDARNSSGKISFPPNGRFDMFPPTFDSKEGIISFIYQEPFRESIISWFERNNLTDKIEKYIYPEVYDSTKDAAIGAVDKDKYLIVFNKLGK